MLLWYRFVVQNVVQAVMHGKDRDKAIYP